MYKKCKIAVAEVLTANVATSCRVKKRCFLQSPNVLAPSLALITEKLVRGYFKFYNQCKTFMFIGGLFMSILQSILLGILQGIAEFLPISSSGHLAVAQHLFNLQDVPLLYDVILHLATLLAVVIFSAKRL